MYVLFVLLVNIYEIDNLSIFIIAKKLMFVFKIKNNKINEDE